MRGLLNILATYYPSMNPSVKGQFLSLAEDLGPDSLKVLTAFLQETVRHKEEEKQEIVRSLNEKLQEQGICLNVKQRSPNPS